MLRKLLLAAVSLGVTFGVLEIVFRTLDLRGFHQSRTREWFDAMRPDEELPPRVRPLFRPYSEFSFRYDSNPRGYFDSDGGLTYRMNRHGFRGPDRPKQKPPGVFRVMVLGDSFAFGEGVRLADTFVARLERSLRARLGETIEVWNFGVGAWGTTSEISFLRHEGLAFEPDLVLVVFTPNDSEGGLDLWDDFRAVYEPPRWLRASYLASSVYANAARVALGRSYIEELAKGAMAEQGRWKITLAMLGQGRRLAESIGAGYAIVIFPFMFELDADHPLRPIHDLVSRFATKAGIAHLDLLPAFEGESYTELWVHPSDQHPNERGHAIAALAIERFLLASELVPAAGAR